MKQDDIREQFLQFLDEHYRKDLAIAVSKGIKSLIIDFGLLDKFNPELSDLVLEKPEETIIFFEKCTEEIDLPKKQKLHVRFKNMPESSKIRIRSIRSEHIGKLLCVDGIVKRASEVRPEVFEIVFECYECGEKMSVIQTEKEKTLQYPNSCEKCKSRRGFKILNQKLYDARWIAMEEPFEITTGERPSEIMIFLKEDLTTPKMQNRTDPGNRIRVNGILKEVPRRNTKGGKTRQLEILLDANNIETVETEWEDILVSPQEEKIIRDLSRDPKIYDKLIASLAPTMYGLETVKLAIILQLFAGVPHLLRDNTRIRGDIHILLIGDPAVGKSQILKLASNMIPRGRYVSGKGVSVDFDDPIIFRENGIVKTGLIGRVIDEYYRNNEAGFVTDNKGIEIPSLNPQTLKMEWKPLTKAFRHYTNEDMFKLLFRTGREVRVTGDHSVFTIENRKITPKKASELKIGDILLIPKKIPQDYPKIHKIDIWKELKKIDKNEIKNIEKKGNYIKSRFSKHKIPKYLKINTDLMRFLGYYIADGSIDYDNRNEFKIKFDIDRKDRKTMDDIKRISKKLFEVEAKEYERKDSNCNNIYIHDKIAYLILKNIFKVGRDATTKKIPDIVFNTESKFQKWFLYGLIKGDYGVTASKELMSDILYLLLMNGIVGSFTTRKIKKIIKFPDGHTSEIDREFYELKSPNIKKILEFQIMNSNLHSRPPIELFQSDLIKILRNNEYMRVSDSDFKRINSRFKKLLVDRLKIITSVVDAKKLSIKANIGIKSAQHYLKMLLKRGFIERENNFYRINEKGKKLLDEIDFLDKLRDSDLAFLKIKNIERIKPTSKFVYDLSVEGYENFVGGFGGVLCHNTGAGLTASVIKDEQFLGGWVLEAGALVLSNNSIISIDEFEKMEKTDQVAMHEAMSLQQVSIAKASIVATLPARTAVLAGANPKYSRFDPYLPIREQVDLSETLLSRFDVKFALKDIANAEIDAKMVDHVLESRHFKQETAQPTLSPEFLRKYIAYARNTCRPMLTEEAGRLLKDFYVDLRSKSSGEESPVPITLRQYEALIRLAEASAKVQLKDRVSTEDAQRAIDIIKFSLRQFGFDPQTGLIDIDRAEGGISTAHRSKIRVVLDIIDELGRNIGRTIPMDELIKRAQEEGVDNVDSIVKSMLNEGTLFSPKTGFIQKI